VFPLPEQVAGAVVEVVALVLVPVIVVVLRGEAALWILAVVGLSRLGLALKSSLAFRLDRDFTTRSYISQTRTERERAFESQAEARESYHRQYPEGSFSSKYNYYDGNKHESNYLYNSTSDLLGQWKHYNLSADTLNYRNQRAKSPLQTREINRYFEAKKRSNYVGDMSSGGGMDFRYYNYRKVPYFGGSDGYQYMMNYKLQNGQRRGL
jgi:hypothetical protein